ncbi:MAG: histidine kinase [Geobacteraceae bacterium GWC2_58_44]|nr:MAG: histidine kinase [Geobacteraceae bacterium GWC2_58_44]HBG07918.1 histidine kinase [Geobacter sp.]
MDDERGIIIADRDAEYRSQVADHFRKAGYRVETTDSAVHVLCSILEKQTPVLLLGNDFDNKVSSADLIHLLKKCNRHLHVIMVSEAMPLAQVRKVRQEGIFYHALKPVAAGDTEELGMAVECAFEKNRADAQARHEPAPKRQRQFRSDGDHAEQIAPAQGTLQPVSWLLCLAALICGVSYLSLAATERIEQGGNMPFWLFLGFCALIIATQLLPIFRIKLPVSGRDEHPAKHEGTSLDEK